MFLKDQIVFFFFRFHERIEVGYVWHEGNNQFHVQTHELFPSVSTQPAVLLVMDASHQNW